MFTAESISYDIFVILLSTTIPTILSFFYFRTVKHFQAEQKKRDEAIKTGKQRLRDDVIKEINKESDKVHGEMMDAIRREMVEAIGPLKADNIDRNTIVEQSINNIADRIAKTENDVSLLHKKIVQVQNETDEILDAKRRPTAKERRNRERSRELH